MTEMKSRKPLRIQSSTCRSQNFRAVIFGNLMWVQLEPTEFACRMDWSRFER